MPIKQHVLDINKYLEEHVIRNKKVATDIILKNVLYLKKKNPKMI